MKRANGLGTCVYDPRIERWRVRLSRKAGGGKRTWLRENGRAMTFASEEEAERILAAISVVQSGGADDVIGSCREAFEAELRRRDGEQDRRDQKNDWSTFRAWLCSSAWIDWPPSAVATRHGVLWVETMLQTPVHGRGVRRNAAAGVRIVGRERVKKALSLATTLFQRLVEKGALAVNPFRGVRVPGKSTRRTEHWTAREVIALLRCEAIPAIERALLGFFVGSGGRHDEIFLTPERNLVLDAAEPHWFVEFGSDAKGKMWPPKNGKTRRVPLFGLSLASAKLYRHLIAAAQWKNPNGLAFPSRREGRRRTRFRDWYEWLAAAGVRPLDSYKLKHTCASLLLSGDMADVIRELLGENVERRRWTLAEIGELFGHSSAEVTQRYAHMTDGALERAARETMGHFGAKVSPPPAKERLVTVKSLPAAAVSNDVAESPARRASGPALSTAGLRTSVQRKGTMQNTGISEPRIGFEPTTAALRSRRGTCKSEELGEARGQAADRSAVFLLSLAVLYSTGVDSTERRKRAIAFLGVVTPLLASGAMLAGYEGVIELAREIAGVRS